MLSIISELADHQSKYINAINYSTNATCRSHQITLLTSADTSAVSLAPFSSAAAVFRQHHHAPLVKQHHCYD